MLLGLVFSLQAWADLLTDNDAGGLAPELRVVILVVAGLVGGGLLALAYAALAWRFRMYRVTSEMVELRTGIVFRSYRHLPFDRIESVDTAQPLIPRALGLAEVRVEAISKQGNELRLRFLSVEEAERLRLELAFRRRPSATEPEQPSDATALIVDVQARELVIGYLVIPALTAAVAIVVGVVIAAFVAGWEGVLSVVLFVVFGSLAVVVPAVVRLERLWDFRIEDADQALVVNRGLLNLNTQRIAAGRIQALRIDQPLLWRPWGRYRLVVDVAGYRGVKNEAAAAAAILLPIARLDVVRYVIQRLEVRADLASLSYEPVPRRARWRSLRWRSFGVAVTDAHVVVRWGVLWRRTAVVSHQRVQSARVTQGPWQRRLQLATVELDTAGSRISVAALHRDARDGVALADDSARRARTAG
jgi:putative membrane protein